MKLWSDSWVNGERIPFKYAAGKPDPTAGVTFSDNLSPHLAWSDVPAGALIASGGTIARTPSLSACALHAGSPSSTIGGPAESSSSGDAVSKTSGSPAATDSPGLEAISASSPARIAPSGNSTST